MMRCRRLAIIITSFAASAAGLFLPQIPSNGSLQVASGSSFPQLSDQKVFNDGKPGIKEFVSPSDGQLLVPVVLGVMSRCPDAQICENVWDKVYDKVRDKIHLELEFIGTFNSSAPYGVSCKHGELECTGNVHQLCIMHLFPQDLWWHAIQCMNYGPISEIGTEKLAIQCTKVIGKDYEADSVKACVEGEKGGALLRESVRWSEHLGISKSCSILINGDIVCIHDESWKQCEGGHEVADFVSQVEQTYKEINAD